MEWRTRAQGGAHGSQARRNVGAGWAREGETNRWQPLRPPDPHPLSCSTDQCKTISQTATTPYTLECKIIIKRTKKSMLDDHAASASATAPIQRATATAPGSATPLVASSGT